MKQPSRTRLLKQMMKIRLDECPVCGKPGSGPYWREVYNRVHKAYLFPFYAHYVGHRGNTSVIDWCYVGKKRLVGILEKASPSKSIRKSSRKDLA